MDGRLLHLYLVLRNDDDEQVCIIWVRETTYLVSHTTIEHSL